MDKGFATNQPPLFDGLDYTYWKTRMSIYLRSLEFGVWTSVINGYKSPNDKEEKDWDANEHKTYTPNYKALNAIVCPLS